MTRFIYINGDEGRQYVQIDSIDVVSCHDMFNRITIVVRGYPVVINCTPSGYVTLKTEIQKLLMPEEVK